MSQRKIFFFTIIFTLFLSACLGEEELNKELDPHEESSEHANEIEEVQDDGAEEQVAEGEQSNNEIQVPDVSAPDVSPPKEIRPPEVSAPEVSISIEDNHIMMEVPDHLLFDFDDASLREDAKELLSEISTELEAYQKADIEIHGHTDSQGDTSYNQQLSEERAEAVEAYFLERKELNNHHFTTRGFGETVPLVSNDSEENRAKNRRVEILIYPFDDD